MNCVIKSNEIIYDINGLQLTDGEYIFIVSDLNNFYTSGEVKLKETNESISNYEFKNSDFIKLLINAQTINIETNTQTISEERNNKSCSICLSNIDDNRYILGCAHHFHENCILRWLQQNSNCPICRCPVEDDICSTENIILINPQPVRIERPRVSPRRRRRRRIATTPIRRRRRGNNTTRNTVIVPNENIPRRSRRSRRIATRRREYSQMFSSSNILNLLQD